MMLKPGASDTVLHSLIQYLGSGGYIDIKPNTPQELTFGHKTVQYERLSGRVTTDGDKARLTFDEPLPTFSVLVVGHGTINALTFDGEKVFAETSLGTHQVYP